MMRNDKTARTLIILDLLESSKFGLTIDVIHSELQDLGIEVNQRTIYRDIEAIQKAGFPLIDKSSESDPSARWSLVRESKVNGYLSLSMRDLVELYLAKETLISSGLPSLTNNGQFFQKIEAKLSNNQRSFLDSLKNDIVITMPSISEADKDTKIFDCIQSACAESHTISIKYQKHPQDPISERTIGPHGLYYSQGSMYLIAEDLKDNKVKTFSIARMKEACMTKELYSPKNKNMNGFLENSFGIYQGHNSEPIKLKFSPIVAPFVSERQWHPSQKANWQNDGHLLLEFDLAITPDLLNWVLGFGENVEVLSPNSLKSKIEDQAHKIIKKYQKAS